MNCHLLIGPPASGKSTFAQVLRAIHKALPKKEDAAIVSTDTVRAFLYGNPAEQGSWPEVEAEVLRLAALAYEDRRPVIFDATNCNPLHRGDILAKLGEAMPGTRWIGWQLSTPVEECHAWNQARERVVPPGVIDAMAAHLEAPPGPEDGLSRVLTVDPRRPDLAHWVLRELNQLSGQP